MAYKFVSLGPGGRNNLTLGAYDALKNADAVYCFGSNGKSYARDIMLDAGIDAGRIIVVDLPMNADRTAAHRVYDDLVATLKNSQGSIVIATEGDTGIFATTHYVMECLAQEGYAVEQTAGIPSFIAAGAMAGLSLVSQQQRLLVVPGNISEEEMETSLSSGTTLVIMKLSRMTAVMHSFISRYPAYEYHYIEKAGTPHARHVTDTAILQRMEYPYFSLMIIKSGAN